MERICKFFYGKGTRPATTLNLVTSLLWLALVALTVYDILEVDLPPIFVKDPTSGLAFNAVTVVVTIIGLVTSGRERQLIKAFALLLGSISNLIIASSFVSDYPPLEVIVIVCATLALWFLGAVVFIVRCEGMNGDANSIRW